MQEREQPSFNQTQIAAINAAKDAAALHKIELRKVAASRSGHAQATSLLSAASNLMLDVERLTSQALKAKAD